MILYIITITTSDALSTNDPNRTRMYNSDNGLDHARLRHGVDQIIRGNEITTKGNNYIQIVLERALSESNKSAASL